MNVRGTFGTLLTSAVLAGVPAPAEGCGCGGPIPSSVSFRGTTAVFVGTVERVDSPQPWSGRNADGSISGGLGSEPEVVTFAVTRAFRGVSETRIRLKRISCDIAFRVEETWLVYASDEQGDLRASHCSRTRLLAQAGEDLKYLEGLAVGRPQGLVYGEVLQQIVDPDGKPVLRALFEVLQVIAVGPAGRFVATTDRWGPYQIVLPPGDFEMWVERKGVPVTAPVSVPVSNGDERRIAFSAQFR